MIILQNIMLTQLKLEDIGIQRELIENLELLDIINYLKICSRVEAEILKMPGISDTIPI
jgi:hypothetical protein|nr:MAG TPA: hypothetical protein [Caudoviricetes sp.]DAV60228.1 MAG TPA: hypothetical protein [Caudoviricetes sp.]